MLRVFAQVLSDLIKRFLQLRRLLMKLRQLLTLVIITIGTVLQGFSMRTLPDLTYSSVGEDLRSP